ncbi:MAG: ABC transporter permease [Synergistaceae bacterium]|nr:ABC transporter permease [Synergistaceae bacterium]
MKKNLLIFSFSLFLFVGIFGSWIAPYSPRMTVAAPFASPIWSSFLSKNETYNFDNALTFETADGAPAIFSLFGTLEVEQKDGAKIVLTRELEGKTDKFILFETKDNNVHGIDLDARDISFKQQLSLAPTDTATEFLFQKGAKYKIEVLGGKAHLEMQLLGKRFGFLGTDHKGRDIFSIMLTGAKTSLFIGISAALVSCILGVIIGCIAGFFGGILDTLLMRLCDILMSIPTLPILLILAAFWGKGILQIVFIMSIFAWMGTARTIRAYVKSLRESAWVQSLQAMGASNKYIISRHIIRETYPIILANIVIGVPSAIMGEAGLSFLGMSDPRIISWGRVLHDAHSFGAFTHLAWWILLPPGLAICLLSLTFITAGRFMEEKLDHRLQDKF